MTKQPNVLDITTADEQRGEDLRDGDTVPARRDYLDPEYVQRDYERQLFGGET